MGNLKSIIKGRQKKIAVIVTLILFSYSFLIIINIFLSAQRYCENPGYSVYCIHAYTNPSYNETCTQLVREYIECEMNKEIAPMMAKDMLLGQAVFGILIALFIILKIRRAKKIEKK